MIASERDNPWQRLSGRGGTFLLSVCCRGAGENAVMTLFDLANCIRVVVSRMDKTSLSPAQAPQTYEVTGISPQSKTVAQLLKGLASRGTLYPPLRQWT